MEVLQRRALTLEPISEADIAGVARFLHEQLNAKVSIDRWAAAMRAPWQVDPPNHGFCLRDGDAIVGAYLALYSERTLNGKRERFCNLAAWCVLENHRTGSIRLLKALLAQEGYTFTDFSPSGNVVPLNRRLGFESLDTSTAIVANLPWLSLPWPKLPGRERTVVEPDELRAILKGDDLEIFDRLADAPAALHIALTRGERYCYTVVRRERRKGLAVFASLLYVSSPEVLQRRWRAFAGHLLVRHGIVATLAELRIVGQRPCPSRLLETPRHKMFRSATLRAEDIDYLYSELVALPW